MKLNFYLNEYKYDRYNWYEDCRNNPLRYIDPSGMIAIPWEDVMKELGEYAPETW